MAKVRNPQGIAGKWSERSSNSEGAYRDGVTNPRVPWQQATAGAANNWKAGVKKASDDNRFQRGVQSTPADKQATNALQKGAPRFSQGVALAQPDYAAGMEPVIRTIEAVQLPPRGPKGDPRNIERVGAIAAALHQNKIQRS